MQYEHRLLSYGSMIIISWILKWLCHIPLTFFHLKSVDRRLLYQAVPRHLMSAPLSRSRLAFWENNGRLPFYLDDVDHQLECFDTSFAIERTLQKMYRLALDKSEQYQELLFLLFLLPCHEKGNSEKLLSPIQKQANSYTNIWMCPSCVIYRP